jgi:hypothetical protein
MALVELPTENTVKFCVTFLAKAHADTEKGMVHKTLSALNGTLSFDPSKSSTRPPVLRTLAVTQSLAASMLVRVP